MSLPESTRRLLPHHSAEEGWNAAVLERLLEDGDSLDLRWLTSVVPEAELARWFHERGCRQLSDRSRAFWGLLLGLPFGARREKGEELWPL